MRAAAGAARILEAVDLLTPARWATSSKVGIAFATAILAWDSAREAPAVKGFLVSRCGLCHPFQFDKAVAGP